MALQKKILVKLMPEIRPLTISRLDISARILFCEESDGKGFNSILNLSQVVEVVLWAILIAPKAIFFLLKNKKKI